MATKDKKLERERFVNKDFIKLMEDVLEHGYKKHGPNSFQYQAERGQLERNDERKKSRIIMEHARHHTIDYVNGVEHDHFNTLEHQLAAVAVNAMIEYVYYMHEKDSVK